MDGIVRKLSALNDCNINIEVGSGNSVVLHEVRHVFRTHVNGRKVGDSRCDDVRRLRVRLRVRRWRETNFAGMQVYVYRFTAGYWKSVYHAQSQITSKNLAAVERDAKHKVRVTAARCDTAVCK